LFICRSRSRISISRVRKSRVPRYEQQRASQGPRLAQTTPQVHFHFTPTSASWLNALEGFFAKLTRQRLKRGVFNGIVDLQAAINRYLVETNQNSKPFIWTADPNAIIEKVRGGKQALESNHSHVRHYQMQASEFVAFEQALVLGSFGHGRRRGRRNDD
jgi:hypothetical protein